MHQQVHCGGGPAPSEHHTVVLRGTHGIAHNTSGLLPHQRHLVGGGCRGSVRVAIPGQDALGNELLQEVEGPAEGRGWSQQGKLQTLPQTSPA